jgi:hypothetical protein
MLNIKSSINAFFDNKYSEGFEEFCISRNEAWKAKATPRKGFWYNLRVLCVSECKFQCKSLKLRALGYGMYRWNDFTG